MVPRKAEAHRPDEEVSPLIYDVPRSSADVVGGADHVVPAVIYDTHVHGLEGMWEAEGQALLRIVHEEAKARMPQAS